MTNLKVTHFTDGSHRRSESSHLCGIRTPAQLDAFERGRQRKIDDGTILGLADEFTNSDKIGSGHAPPYESWSLMRDSDDDITTCFSSEQLERIARGLPRDGHSAPSAFDESLAIVAEQLGFTYEELAAEHALLLAPMPGSRDAALAEVAAQLGLNYDELVEHRDASAFGESLAIVAKQLGFTYEELAAEHASMRSRTRTRGRSGR